jgi:Phage integrase family
VGRARLQERSERSEGSEAAEAGEVRGGGSHPEQTRGFLKSISGYRLKALFFVALLMGLRRGELCGLRWRDLNFTTGMLSVKRSMHRPKGQGQQLKSVKSEDSRRELPMPASVAEALMQHRDAQEAERKALGPRWKEDEDFAFKTSIGTRMTLETPLRELQLALARAGLPELRLHDLRHGFASLLIDQGNDLKMVSEALGHSTIQITADLYGHLFPSKLAKAMSGMGRHGVQRHRRRGQPFSAPRKGCHKGCHAEAAAGAVRRKALIYLVPGGGLEPPQPCGLRILSPLRLPISPSGLCCR